MIRAVEGLDPALAVSRTISRLRSASLSTIVFRTSGGMTIEAWGTWGKNTGADSYTTLPYVSSSPAASASHPKQAPQYHPPVASSDSGTLTGSSVTGWGGSSRRGTSLAGIVISG